MQIVQNGLLFLVFFFGLEMKHLYAYRECELCHILCEQPGAIVIKMWHDDELRCTVEMLQSTFLYS